MPMLTPAQKATLKAFILADGTLSVKAAAFDYDFIANALNALVSPDFWVWRTNVTRSEIYNTTDWEAGTWNWTTYKNQGVTEQNAWTQMFMGDEANFAQANLRAGVAAIFTGSAQANAQRDHVLSVGRRKANLLEKVLSNGTGSSASPAVMGVEGAIGAGEIGGVLS